MESVLIPAGELNKIIPEDNELGEMDLMMAKCKKISSWGIKQDRILLLSTHQIYVLKTNFEIRKQVAIAELRYMIKCGKSNEVLLYFNGHFDFRLVVEQKDEMFDLIKLRFPQFCPTIPLKMFIVDDQPNLDKYKVGSNNRRSQTYGFSNEPDKKYRHRS